MKNPSEEKLRVEPTDPRMKIVHLERWEKFLATGLLLIPLGIGFWLASPSIGKVYGWIVGNSTPPLKIISTIAGWVLYFSSCYVIERLFQKGWLSITVRKMRDNVVPFRRKKK